MFGASSRQTFRRLTSSSKRIGRRYLSKGEKNWDKKPEGKEMLYAAAGVGLVTLVIVVDQKRLNGPRTGNSARLPTSGDILSMGTPVKEKATGIFFPPLCNGFSLAGTGVRVKWGFVKVYAVGTYLDPVAMMGVKKGSNEEIKKALLDPTYPRTIRIVMNRGLAIQKFTDALVESIQPRLKGQELETLEQFKKLSPPVDLVEGAEIEMTIRGDTLLFKNAVGGVGSIHSRLFCEAMCDIYYGDDAVSPSHLDEVIAGVRKL